MIHLPIIRGKKANVWLQVSMAEIERGEDKKNLLIWKPMAITS